MRNLEGFLSPAFPELIGVGQACFDVMPVDTWWGIKFLDAKYLFSFDKSPAVEAFRFEGGFRVKLAGSHQTDPGLTPTQLEVIENLGFSQSGGGSCDCLLSPWGDAGQATSHFVSALNILSFVYGVEDDAILTGSNDFVALKIQEIERAKYNKKHGGYRLFASRSFGKDLR